MAVPKRKTSPSKRNMRRSHHALSATNFQECPNCGERHRSDTSVCVCGYNFLAPDQNLIAEPFLTAEEVAALRGKPLRRS